MDGVGGGPESEAGMDAGIEGGIEAGIEAGIDWRFGGALADEGNNEDRF